MPETGRPAYQLVRLDERHIEGMVRVFNLHIADGFAAYPEEFTNADAMRSYLRQVADYPAVAVEGQDGAVLGFGFLRAYSPHATFAHTAQITTFLDPAHTRTGIGTAVLEHLEDGACGQGITILLAHISSRNPASLTFHAKHGSIECGRFPEIGRKRGETFDVVWMVKALAEDAA